MRYRPTRQIHLDFHTSPDIPAVAAQFDADAFADAMAEARVQSVTVFARCVHGYLYYPSERFPERVHPTLACRDLLPRQVDALHARGIQAPVYIAVQWDRYTAERRPEWLIRKPDGRHEGAPFSQPGFDQSLCVNTGYRAFLFEHTREVMRLLGDRLDGLFFDMVGIRPCTCAACRREMRLRRLDLDDERAVRAFAKESMDRFKADMSKLVRSLKPDCAIFYNAGHIGPCTVESADAYTHFELESLPSGQWGYLHFPITARYARTLGKDCVGMTGKFHREWGDFHSLKNQAALEYECFRMLQFGLGCSIGDQLEPNGRINPATYRLIGRVYGQVEAYEPYARPSVPLTEAALLTPEDSLTELRLPESVMGAAQLLDELALQYDIIDPDGDFSAYPLLILPDGLRLTEEQRRRVDIYVKSGGRALALGLEGPYPDCFQAESLGEEPLTPSFVIARGPLAEGLEPGNEYVVYRRGQALRAREGGEEALFAHEPYFNREGERFCSHGYTPSSHGAEHPVAVRTERTLAFAHPLMSQYRDCAPRWCKLLVRNALDALLPNRLVRSEGPSTLTVSVLHQPEQRRYCLHLLCYVPVRKCRDIDVLEERTELRDVSLRLQLPHAPLSAQDVDGAPVTLEGDRLTLSRVNGYAVVELPYA